MQRKREREENGARNQSEICKMHSGSVALRTAQCSNNGNGVEVKAFDGVGRRKVAHAIYSDSRMTEQCCVSAA